MVCGRKCGFLKIFRREVIAFLCGTTLWAFVLVAVGSPWFSIAGYNISYPYYDTATGVFWWNGLNLVYSPPLPPNNTREIILGWEEMADPTPKNIYMTSMAMTILAFAVTTVLQVFILFGLVFRPTGRILNLMACGLFKWIIVLIALFDLILLILSWSIFLVFPEALYQAEICLGSKWFPAGRNLTDDSNKGVSYGLWCCGFQGQRTIGTGNWLWAPSLGWIFAIICTTFAFIIFIIILSIDGNKYKLAALKRVANSVKSSRGSKKKQKFSLDEGEDDDEDWELTKTRKGRRAKQVDEEEEDDDPREREPLTKSMKGRRARPQVMEEDDDDNNDPRSRAQPPARKKRAPGATPSRRSRPALMEEDEGVGEEEVAYASSSSKGRRGRR